MTITISLWMLIPGALVLCALVLVYLASKETGMFAGLVTGMGAIALFAMAGVFLLGRWLA